MKIVGGVLHCRCHAVHAICEDDKVKEAIAELKEKNRQVVAVYADGEWSGAVELLRPENKTDWENYFQKRLDAHGG